MSNSDLQLKIREEMRSIGWSHGDFVREYDKHHKYKSGLKEESFKKQLRRSTTQHGLLRNYLEFIYKHDVYLNSEMINPKNESEYIFSEAFNNQMKCISRKITESIEDDL